MGGTRFVGKAIVERLGSMGHSLTLFTRGRNEVPRTVEHVQGDRSIANDLLPLQGRTFDVIIDSSGRTLKDSQSVLEVTGAPNYRFLYVSSAGVYSSVEELPLDEGSSLDPLSRHSGKAETEHWLKDQGIPFTSFRPTYIYGPGNYNPIESWFFDRIIHQRPVPLPLDGQTITQLGHVNDLADAMVMSLNFEVATNRIYNCSGKKAITFRGLLEAAARACKRDPVSIKTYSFDPVDIDPKARKVFPLRMNHFFTDISLIERELNWQPSFDLEEGLSNSFQKDYSLNSSNHPDFTLDINLIGA